MSARSTFSPEERKARMDAAHSELTAAVEAISTSDDWTAFLDFARKLHSYSAQNRMWLFSQAMTRDGMGTSGDVAGFQTGLEPAPLRSQGREEPQGPRLRPRQGQRRRWRALRHPRFQGGVSLRRVPDRW